MIEVENLYKSYGTKEIFKNQSITLDNHCIYALVGVNGIGKSTFLNAITQPYLLDKGVVKIDGIYSSEFQAKYHYAFVPDTKEMFLNLTGKEYLDFVCGLYNQRERCTDLISDYITNLKLENSLDMTIQTYSLGMKQKIYLFFASTFSSKMQIDFLKVAWGISPVLHFLCRHSFRCRRGAVAGIQSLLVTDM